MTLARLLDIRPGVTAVIGSGGKTTLLRMLGEELAEAGGRVLLCTTTKILPFPGLPCACDRAELDDLAASRLLCAGMPLENGKLTVPEIPVAELAARFDYVLVEADGSARLPLKAHASHEPVIPPEANQTICLVGVFGRRRTGRSGSPPWRVWRSRKMPHRKIPPGCCWRRRWRTGICSTRRTRRSGGSGPAGAGSACLGPGQGRH